jgi:hypothetical protein
MDTNTENLLKNTFFALVDEYSRTRHGCYLAELFPDKAYSEYTLCLLPTKLDAPFTFPNRYFRYVRIDAEEVRTAARTGVLGASIIERLDAELTSLRASMK